MTLKKALTGFVIVSILIFGVGIDSARALRRGRRAGREGGV